MTYLSPILDDLPESGTQGCPLPVTYPHVMLYNGERGTYLERTENFYSNLYLQIKYQLEETSLCNNSRFLRDMRHLPAFNSISFSKEENINNYKNMDG